MTVEVRACRPEEVAQGLVPIFHFFGSTPSADALEMLIQNDRLRIELSARARRRALDFSPARMAEAYLTGYAQCRGQESIGVAA